MKSLFETNAVAAALTAAVTAAVTAAAPVFIGLALTLASGFAAAKTTVLSVNGMVCSFCAQGIEKRLSALPQTQGVFVDLKKKMVVVEARAGMAFDKAVLEREIVEAGYDVTKVEDLERSVADFKAAAKAKK